MRQYNHKILGMAISLLLMAGCEDTSEPIPTPAVTISIASTNISVQRGQSKAFPVTVTRSGGFSGSVVVSVTGLPVDLSAGCDPSAVLGSSTTLNVTAGPSQALGQFTATVKATGSGVATKTILLTITVTQ